MNNPLLVSVLQGRADLPAQLDDFLPGQSAAALEDMVERLALDVLHRIIGGTLESAGDIEAHNITGTELFEDFRFALEPCQGRVITSQPRRHDLERDPLAGLAVACLIDRAHGAAAQLLLDLKGSHTLPGSHTPSSSLEP